MFEGYGHDVPALMLYEFGELGSGSMFGFWWKEIPSAWASLELSRGSHESP
jgi:hypothetical protein